MVLTVIINSEKLNTQIGSSSRSKGASFNTGLEILRNTIRSVNTSVILDQPILDDNTAVLKPTKKFIAKSKLKIKDCLKLVVELHTAKTKGG